jgi:hypothetical protein
MQLTYCTLCGVNGGFYFKFWLVEQKFDLILKNLLECLALKKKFVAAFELGVSRFFSDLNCPKG